VSAAEVRGVEALEARLAAAGAQAPAEAALRGEAEAIAEDARRAAPGRLGATVEIRDASRDGRPAFAVGSAHRAARFLEHGTLRMAARPWLWPAFWARSPNVKHKLRQAIGTAFRKGRGRV
jgi:HK97 gp10 family phage protein